MEQHKQIFEKVFSGTVQTYKNTLTNYYPSFESIGFTERNLTFNFCHNYFSVNGYAKVWQEVPLNVKNEKGKYDEHYDSLIIDEKNRVLVIIEAKRLNSERKLYSINEDYNRIMSQFSKINAYEKYREFSKYGILLADIWIPREGPKNTSKMELLKKFEYFSKVINSYFLKREVDAKISETEEYHLLCSVFCLEDPSQ